MSVDNTVIQLDPALQAGFESCGSAFADSELTADESLLTHAKQTVVGSSAVAEK